MTAARNKLSREEIAQVFSGCKPLISPDELASVWSVSVKTVYQWKAEGRLDGTFCRVGKHTRFWRDRVIEKLFNGDLWEKQNV